jgi:hypothetical protein
MANFESITLGCCFISSTFLKKSEHLSDYCAVTPRTALNREVFQKVNSEVEKKTLYISHENF